MFCKLFWHKAFPGILQVIISNNMVLLAKNSLNQLVSSDREIHAPPPQNRRSTSRVQNWGWCVFCLFLGF